MFTGLIEATGKILKKTDATLTLERPASFDDCKIGSSISVAGTCLSIVDMNDATMTFDVVPETWAKTNLAMKKVGDGVNLERALKVNGRFEGHVVQGHVEDIATVVAFAPTPPPPPPSAGEGGVRVGTLTINLSPTLQSFVIPKGSIAIDGVSLTVASLEGNTCTVALIPLTIETTTLGSLKPGDTVNIETDILGRYLLAKRS